METPIIITPEILRKNGFEEKPVHTYCGNGHDIQDPPEKGGSRTTIIDLVIHGIGRGKDFFVRFESFEYEENGKIEEEKTTTIGFGEWSPWRDCSIECHDPSLARSVELAYELFTGKKMQLKIE